MPRRRNLLLWSSFAAIPCAPLVLVLVGALNPVPSEAPLRSKEFQANKTSQVGIVIEGAAKATPHEIRELLKTLNENPNRGSFSEYTPSVMKLIKIGRPAIRETLELMLSDDRETRIHAYTVIEGITLVEHGFRFGQGW